MGFHFFNLELSEMTKMFDSVLSNMVATSHTGFWALDMVYVSEEMSLELYFILIKIKI